MRAVVPPGAVTEMQAGDADVDVDRRPAKAGIDRRPVAAGNRLPESLGHGLRGGRLIEIREEEAELIAAEARVQRGSGPAFVLRMSDAIRRTHLAAQQPGHRLDDPVPGGVA